MANWAIACWEIRSPMSEELDKRPIMKSTVRHVEFCFAVIILARNDQRKSTQKM
jgi:hypothetical protein